MNLLRGATVSVADPAATAARYKRWFDYSVVEEGRIDAQLARSYVETCNRGRVTTVGNAQWIRCHHYLRRLSLRERLVAPAASNTSN